MSLFQGSYRPLGDAIAVDVAILDPTGAQLSGFDASRPATAAITNVPSSATSVTILAANAARRQVIIQNKSTKVLYLAFAATATLSLFTVIVAANGVYESPLNGYTGLITGIWSAVNGSAVVTEVTT